MMEGLLEFCDAEFNFSREKSFRLHLGYCQELKVLKQTSENEFTSIINRLLNEPSTRRQGIYLLKIYLDQSSSQVLCANLVSWCSQVFKGVHIDFPVSYDVLSRLVELSVEYSDSRKHVDQVFLSKLVNSILAIPKIDVSVPALKCLENCLQYYSRSCKNISEKIENYLLNIINREGEIICAAGRCFAKAIASKTSDYWLQRHFSMLKTVSSLVDALFENVGEVKSSDTMFSESDSLKIPSVPTLKQVSLLVHFQRQAIQFCNLAKYLEMTVLVGAGIYRSVAVESMIELISRVLAVTTSTLASRPSAESSYLSAQIPMLHRAVLGILHALILSGQTNLLPYTSSITKMLINALKATNSNCEDVKLFEFTREKCYTCLKSWLRVNGTAPSLMPSLKSLLEVITSDIKMTKTSASLNISGKKEEKRKKGKKNSQPSNQVVSSRSISSSEAVCLAALSTLNVLISSASCILSPEDHRALQEIVIKLLIDLIQAANDIPFPYSISECRGELYSCLSALCVTPHPGFPPPLHYAQFIFHSGLSDKSHLVSERCSNALASIGHMLRPPCPSFNFPIDVSGMHCQISQDKVENDSPDDCDKTIEIPTKTLSLQNESPKEDDSQEAEDTSVATPSNGNVELVNLEDTTSRNPTVIDSPPLSPNKDEITVVSDSEEIIQPSGSKRPRNTSEDLDSPNKRAKDADREVVLVSDDDKSSSDCEIIESEVSKDTEVYEIAKTPTGSDNYDAEMEEMLSSFVDSVP